MNAVKTRHNWAAFLKFYNEQNAGRRTRLGVFENDRGVVNDYWIEDGLPLKGLDIDVDGELPSIEIMFSGYSHSVNNARGLKIHYSLEGNEDGIDITGNDGKTTVLRFEDTC